MQGKRIEDGYFPENPGEYSKHEYEDKEGNTVVFWVIKVPTGGAPCFIGRPNSDGSPYHWVRENDDGTITVETMPSDAPDDRRNSNSILWNNWHGFIHNGVWVPA